MSKARSRAKAGVPALERSPSHLLHRAQQLAVDLHAAEFGQTGLTQRQYAVLAAVAEREGATQSDLVRATGIDRSTLADMMARMIRKDLIARERAEGDARANAVRLTPAGQAALAEAQPKVAAADARLLKLVGGGGRRSAFLELLRDLVRAGEPQAEDKPKKAKSEKTDKAEKAPKAKKTGKKKSRLKKAA